MSESDNYTHMRGEASKTNIDDYLPDSSPRPHYVITTIYPPSNDHLEVPEREVTVRNGFIVPPVPSPRTGQGRPDRVIVARPEDGGTATGERDLSGGMAYPSAEGACPEHSANFLKPLMVSNLSTLPNPSPEGAELSPRRFLSHMSLPRGKFISLERDVSIISLLRNLHRSEFRGTCWINLGGSNIRLVYDAGRIILAEYDNLGGDMALWMIYTQRFTKGDVLISDLDEAQVRLALEFNRPWCVKGNQEPAWIASGANIQDAGNIQPGGSDSGPDHYPETSFDSEMRPVYPDPGSSDTSQTGIDAETTSGDTLPSTAEEEGSLTGSSVENDQPGWRKDPAVPSHARNHAPLPPADPSKKDIHGSCGPLHSEDPAMGERWKKALYMPVKPAGTGDRGYDSHDKINGPAPAMLHEFELLPADSVLFEDIPIRKKLRRVSGPEPAEQWKYMGINRGQNSSV